MIKLLIDADPLVYRSGFAAQETVNDEVFGEAVIAQPVENALQIVKTSLKAMTYDVEERFNQVASESLVLSGPDNFRFKIATIRPYKGNRPARLPVHYQAIRDYLTERGAKVIHRREADDEISIRAWRLWNESGQDGRHAATYVVATIDKDLDQIPGWHYDYMKHVFYFVDEDDARAALWTQILSGDPSDNVPGCWKVGRTKAHKLIQSYISQGASDLRLWNGAIVNTYAASQFHEDCPYKNLKAADVALETAQLVYMQREPGELWNPPPVPHGKVEGDEDD
jgi:hypothetical protein